MKQITTWIQRHRLRTALMILGIAVVITILVMRKRSQVGAELTEPLKKGTVIESVYGIGTVTAKNSYQLKVGVTSGIQQIFVREGDSVQRGQKLLLLQGGASFSAPFAGTVTYLPAKVGETVFPQSIVMSLVDLVDRYIIVSLEQRGAIRVRPGQRAKISFDNLRDMTFEGVVQSVYSNESNFLVRITVASLPPQLLPGMTADVAITISEHPDVLVIPLTAIEDGQVVVQRGRRKENVSVQTGVVDGAFAEVLSGDLKEGDRLYFRKKMKP